MAPSDPPEDAPTQARGEDGVVRPDDLDYTASERVAELSEGRYVVATDNDDEPPVDADADDGATDADQRGTLARQQMGRYISERGADYGFALTAAFGGDVQQREVFSNDVATAFSDLVSWYVTQIDTEATPSEALGILLLASETSVTYPTNALVPVLQEHGLTLDDSISDLVLALGDAGLQIPPDE